MPRLVIFCKSYKPDMLRVRRLAQSIALYNQGAIPFYISVPASDRAVFVEHFRSYPCHILTDEDVIAKSQEMYGPIPSTFPLHLVQQLVKLEFWRMGLAEHYLWIDSDSYFIRNFTEQDFFRDGIPLTVMHEKTELFDFMEQWGNYKVRTDFQSNVRRIQQLFRRVGPDYDFGPSPVLWSADVLRSLSDAFIRPRGLTIYEILEQFPVEITLYGEYLLSLRESVFHPCPPFFKVFHYQEQFLDAQEKGEWDYSLAQCYLGVVMQSNWARLKQPAKKRLGKRFVGLLQSQLRALVSVLLRLDRGDTRSEASTSKRFF